MSKYEKYTKNRIPDFSNNQYLFQLTFGRKLSSLLHCHEFYEIIYIVSGSCTHETNDEAYSCREGSLQILRPNDHHRFIDQTESTNVAALSVTCEEIQPFLTAYGLEKDIRFLDTSDIQCPPPGIVLPPSAHLYLKQLCEKTFADTSSPRANKIKVLLGKIISCFLEYEFLSSAKIPESFIHILTEMSHLENAAEGVPAFLRISNFSHAQLCRLTKRYLRKTPIEYINDIRLEHAYNYIAYSNLDYYTICEMVGFSSFSHFSSLIKCKYGQSPAKIRRQEINVMRTL